MYVPVSSSLLFTLPKIELLAQDRRSGAYPTKARTGDRTRTGKNAFYFDDTRTVTFATGTSINLPTTFRSGSAHLTSSLASSLTVVGDVKPHAVDQWIKHRDQSEPLGAFKDNGNYEQNENAVVNSDFMTGTAYYIAPLQFKSKLSNKTIVRMEIPLTRSSTLDPLSGAIYYLNPGAAKFDTVANEINRNPYAGARFPTTAVPLLFTPYGMHYLPVKELPFSVPFPVLDAKQNYPKATSYAGDGGDSLFFDASGSLQQTMSVTASVLNTRHKANSSQSIDLSQFISQPFLLEKAVIEFPFEAGPGWLNDRFGFRSTNTQGSILDVGGPLITFALLRQDSDSRGYRDVIASSTLTNRLDATSGSYHIMSTSQGGFTQVSFTPEGVGHLVNPGFVVAGTNSPSGSSNFFTGTIKLVMEPAMTSHAFRLRASGSGVYHYYVQSPTNSDGGKPKTNDSYGMMYGPIGKRVGNAINTSRNILGNHFAFIDLDQLDGTLNPVKVIDTQYENLSQDSTNNVYKVKVYTDVISSTTRSPYLLYPEDKLILCINKHRAVGTPLATHWTSDGASTYRTPMSTVSQHDVKISTGSLKITLYGDLIKEDREFHDTLNQRLETKELWETLGEEPVLDQFDVTYAAELSGSYLDRNNVLQFVPFLNQYVTRSMSSSMDFARDIGHFSSEEVSSKLSYLAYSQDAFGLGKPRWLDYKYSYEYRKSNRNLVAFSTTERFWDTRIPDPRAVASICNSNFALFADEMYLMHAGVTSSFVSNAGRGLLDWYMTHPYEQRYDNATKIFVEGLTTNVWRTSAEKNITVNYKDIRLEVGPSTPYMTIYSDSDASGGETGMSTSEFVKVFYGIGDGVSDIANQYVTPRRQGGNDELSVGADIRGWRYGMMNAFSVYSNAVFRRSRFGQVRDMLEQRVDAKFFTDDALQESPLKVEFYDREGNLTDPLLTLSSNLSNEATSSCPYADGLARNRSEIDYSNLNIVSMVL